MVHSVNLFLKGAYDTFVFKLTAEKLWAEMWILKNGLSLHFKVTPVNLAQYQ